MTKHRNEHGFGVVQVALIVLVLAGIGFAGWQVYNNTDDSPKNSAITSDTTAKKNQLKEPGQSNVSTEGWQTHSAAMYTMRFPKDWTFVQQGEKFTAADGSQQESIEDQLVPKGETPNQGKELALEQHDNAKYLSAEQFAQENAFAQGEVVSKKSFKANGNDAYSETVGGIQNSSQTTRVIIVNSKFPTALIFNYDTVSSYSAIFETIFQTVQFQNSCQSTVGC